MWGWDGGKRKTCKTIPLKKFNRFVSQGVISLLERSFGQEPEEPRTATGVQCTRVDADEPREDSERR